MRYLYLAYGIAPYGANGNTVVPNYRSSYGGNLRVIGNGTPGGAPQPGDVLSYGASTHIRAHSGRRGLQRGRQRQRYDQRCRREQRRRWREHPLRQQLVGERQRGRHHRVAEPRRPGTHAFTHKHADRHTRSRAARASASPTSALKTISTCPCST